MRFINSILLVHGKRMFKVGIIVLFSLIVFAITKFNDKRADNILYRFIQRNHKSEIIIKMTLTNNVSCHNQTENDGLPQLGKTFNPPPKSIFLFETSCKGGLNSRQACAVESAARANPNWDVYVFFSGPISEYVLERSCLARLLTYSSIKLLRVHLEDYAKGTPLQEIVEGVHKTSIWPVHHTSDVLRFLTLYKFGGVYMDSDMIVVKSFDTLTSNWAGREDEIAIDAGLLSFSRDALGREMADAAIQYLKNYYNPKIWAENGPGVITHIVYKMCSQNNTNKNWNNGCKGFVVYEPEVFYPVHYSSNIYFIGGEELDVSNKTYAHHFWNACSANYTIPSTSPYVRLAKEYCPRVYDMYGEQFGD